MQKTCSNEFRIVYIPRLSNVKICPVNALQVMIQTMNLVHSDPLFMIHEKGHRKILTAFKVRNVLAQAVRQMGLHPQEFGFHAFRRSGASLAFNENVPLEYIKVHGHWKSNAVWAYLKKCTTGSSSGCRYISKPSNLNPSLLLLLLPIWLDLCRINKYYNNFMQFYKIILFFLLLLGLNNRITLCNTLICKCWQVGLKVLALSNETLSCTLSQNHKVGLFISRYGLECIMQQN